MSSAHRAPYDSRRERSPHQSGHTRRAYRKDRNPSPRERYSKKQKRQICSRKRTWAVRSRSLSHSPSRSRQRDRSRSRSRSYQRRSGSRDSNPYQPLGKTRRSSPGPSREPSVGYQRRCRPQKGSPRSRCRSGPNEHIRKLQRASSQTTEGPRSSSSGSGGQSSEDGEVLASGSRQAQAGRRDRWTDCCRLQFTVSSPM